eukprot:m.534763 g.534763  ORF g.534763 m.534763 type:complete len:62 (-) comp22059_c0_seq7:370-555(-)
MCTMDVLPNAFVHPRDGNALLGAALPDNSNTCYQPVYIVMTHNTHACALSDETKPNMFLQR